jgi:hypothetical protein
VLPANMEIEVRFAGDDAAAFAPADPMKRSSAPSVSAKASDPSAGACG